MWTSRLPQPIRRLMWWLGFNLLGRVRAYFYGTFGITSVGAFGVDALTILSPLTTTLTYGAVDAAGNVSVRLCFDHRVMNRAAPGSEATVTDNGSDACVQAMGSGRCPPCFPFGRPWVGSPPAPSGRVAPLSPARVLRRLSFFLCARSHFW